MAEQSVSTNEMSSEFFTIPSKDPSPHSKLLIVEDQETKEGNRGRKRSRSPYNKVLTRFRSSSLGRSLSNLRIRYGSRHRSTNQGRSNVSATHPPRRASATSIHEVTDDTNSPESKQSPRRWHLFPRRSHTHPKEGGSSPPPTINGVLHSVRRQINNLTSRHRHHVVGRSRTSPPCTLIHDQESTHSRNEAVAEWLGQNPLTNDDPGGGNKSSIVEVSKQEDNNDEVEEDDVEENEAEEEDDDAMSSASERVKPARTMTENTEESATSHPINDDAESTWTEASRLTDLLRKSMIKSKDHTSLKSINVWEVNIHLISGTQLVIRDSTGTSDPYVKFKYKGKLLEKSKIVRRSLNPIWDEFFCFYIDDNKKPIEVRVYDHDKLSDDYMGRTMIDLATLELDSNTELTLELEDETGKSKEKFMGTVRLACKVSTFVFDPDNCSTVSARTALSAKSTTDKRGIKTSIDTGRNRFKSVTYIATVSITLIEGKNLLPMDNNGLSDPFVKFRLGSEKYRTKVQKSTLNPHWLEQFDMRLSNEGGDAGRILEITVWDHDDIGRNDFMGRTTIDLSQLRREYTHMLELALEDGAGHLSLLITISGSYETDSASDLRNYSISEVDRQRLLAKFSFFRTLGDLSDVGWLQVKVLKAEGLVATSWSGKMDSFCVVELVNSRLQTHTEYKSCEPEWNKVFVFNVLDIHSDLEVSVYDEDRDKKAEFVGMVAIPLLRIRNGEKRWYALKDRKLMRRVKGAVLLEMDIVYNQARAAWRTINPKEKKIARPCPKFKIATMRRHIDRCGRIIDNFILFSQFVESCWSWESPPRTIIAFISYLVIVWTFELYMLPLTLVIIFIKEYTFNRIYAFIYRKTRPEESPLQFSSTYCATTTQSGAEEICSAREYSYATSSDEDDDKSDKEDRRTIKERIQSVQDIMLNVQEYMGNIATMFERIHNTFLWSVPWLSMFAVIVLIIGTIVLYLVPLRWLLLLWGINKFTRKVIRPNSIDNNELLDFLSRVPSSLQLLQYKETKPDLSSGADSKKR